MSAIAKKLARVLWWYMLWFMRRPWMKRLQRHFFAPSLNGRVRQASESFKRQNRWARRWGLRMLTVSMNVLIASVLLTVIFETTLQLYESGALAVPEKRLESNP